MKRHVYTDSEIALVRSLYETHTAAQIAEQIHGTPRVAKSIYQLAFRLGLRKTEGHLPEFVEQIRALHAEGLSDTEIAARLGSTREIVHPIRYARLKLPPNAEGIARGHRRAIEGQRRSLGIESAGQLRALSHRRYAVEQGWPEDLRPRAVQILNALAVRGPMNRRQICEAIGMPWKGSRKSLVSNDVGHGSYLAALKARGLVCYIPQSRPAGSQGKGCIGGLYSLTTTAIEMIEQHLQKGTQCPEPTV